MHKVPNTKSQCLTLIVLGANHDFSGFKPPLDLNLSQFSHGAPTKFENTIFKTAKLRFSTIFDKISRKSWIARSLICWILAIYKQWDQWSPGNFTSHYSAQSMMKLYFWPHENFLIFSRKCPKYFFISWNLNFVWQNSTKTAVARFLFIILFHRASIKALCKCDDTKTWMVEYFYGGFTVQSTIKLPDIVCALFL